MTSWNRLAKALAVVLPAGAFGASVVLALASSGPASTPGDQNRASQPPSGEGVSVRLQEIRSGISSMTGSAGMEGDAKASPAWWGNGGWGRWHLGWGNGGWPNWHNGGWRNGGWGNGGWPNWHNGGWGNGGWHNGWHNFWHNW